MPRISGIVTSPGPGPMMSLELFQLLLPKVGVGRLLVILPSERLQVPEQWFLGMVEVLM